MNIQFNTLPHSDQSTERVTAHINDHSGNIIKPKVKRADLVILFSI